MTTSKALSALGMCTSHGLENGSGEQEYFLSDIRHKKKII